MSAESVREFYRRQGRTDERERIIELLEAAGWVSDDGDFWVGRDYVIELIKGETE